MATSLRIAAAMRSRVGFDLPLCLCLCLAKSSAFVMPCVHRGRSLGVRMAMQGGNDATTPSAAAPLKPITATTNTSKLWDRRAFVQGAVAIVPLMLAGATAAFANKENTSGRNPPVEWKEPEITEKAFMDISIGDKPVGRLVIALYGGVVPETVRNFVSLLKGDNPDGSTYKGTEAYKVLDGLNIQMGAIGSRSGKSGKSATGESFGPENFEVLHMKEGLLSMVKNQDAKNDSRFFISIQNDAGWADNRYVAFGRVVEGMSVVHEIERVKVEGGSNHPTSPVVISDCGLL